MKVEDPELEGIHEPVIVCPQCKYANEINRLSEPELKDDDILQYDCRLCNDEMFRLGAKRDVQKELIGARSHIETAIDTLEILSNNMTNVNTDEEVEEMEEEIEYRCEKLENCIKDLNWFHG